MQSILTIALSSEIGHLLSHTKHHTTSNTETSTHGLQNPSNPTQPSNIAVRRSSSTCPPAPPCLPNAHAPLSTPPGSNVVLPAVQPHFSRPNMRMQLVQYMRAVRKLQLFVLARKHTTASVFRNAAHCTIPLEERFAWAVHVQFH
jgi:hypothetical protein